MHRLEQGNTNRCTEHGIRSAMRYDFGAAASRHAELVATLLISWRNGSFVAPFYLFYTILVAFNAMLRLRIPTFDFSLLNVIAISTRNQSARKRSLAFESKKLSSSFRTFEVIRATARTPSSSKSVSLCFLLRLNARYFFFRLVARFSLVAPAMIAKIPTSPSANTWSRMMLMRFPVRRAESFGNFNAGVNISAWDVRVCGTADTCGRFVRRPRVQRKEEFINISRFRSATLGSAR